MRKPFSTGDAIALGAPTAGRMSKRARKAAMQRLGQTLFGEFRQEASVELNQIAGEVRKTTNPTLDQYAAGDVVIARFTNSGRVHEFTGRVVGRTKNYWKVESITSPYAAEGEQPGRVFHVATLESRIYSANNCIRSKEQEAGSCDK